MEPLKDSKWRSVIYRNNPWTNQYIQSFYADVPEALKRWKENGIKVAIYSSGSVKAQKLLFRYAESGDLSGYISDYFDTSSGYKQIPQSYRNIVESLQVKEPGKILFLTDVIKG